jgi:hypothetical protein
MKIGYHLQMRLLKDFWFHEVQFSSLWISGILFLKILWIKKFRIFIKGFYRENHIQKL